MNCLQLISSRVYPSQQQQQQQQQQQPQRCIDPEAQRLKQLIQQLEQQENNGKQDNEIHISYEELVNLKSRLQQHQEKVRLHKLQKSSCISNQQSQSSSTAAAAATTSAVPLFAQLRNSTDDSNSLIMNSNSNPSGEVYGSNALVEAVSSSDDFYDYECDLQSDDVLSKKISNSSFKNGSESDESTNSYSTTVSSSMYSSLNINESNKYDFLFEDIREIYKCNNDDMELGDPNGDDSTNPNGNSEINENSIGMMEKFMGNTNVFNGHNFTTSKFSEKERLRRATILEKLSLKVSRNIKEERMKLRTKNRKMYFTRKSYYKNKWNYKTWKDFEINREDHQVLSVSHNNITMCPMHHKSTASYSASGNYAPSNTTTTTTSTSNIKQEQTMQRNQDFSLFSVDSPSMSSSFSSPSPNITGSSSNGPSSNKSAIAVEKSLDTDLFPIKRLNVFPLVEKFTVKQLNPKEICYWATVIVRNSNKKDESKGGRRQCAFFGCGKWESTPRQFAKCRRCKRAKYCSKDCQSKAWTYHKYWCSAPNSASSTTSSTSTSTSNSVATVPQPVGGMAAHIGPTGIPIFSPVQPPAAKSQITPFSPIIIQVQVVLILIHHWKGQD
ncbi:unnamed protein product [[Candida] boidinii]|nr:unnamed protein product [[Candida] boidinii]